jgi:hypothetical protein
MMEYDCDEETLVCPNPAHAMLGAQAVEMRFAQMDFAVAPFVPVNPLYGDWHWAAVENQVLPDWDRALSAS